MDESFERFKQSVSSPDAFSDDDVLDEEALRKLGGVLTREYVIYDDASRKEEERQRHLKALEGETKMRELEKLTIQSTDSSTQKEVWKQQAFDGSKNFFYEQNRIKSVDVLCRQLRTVLTEAGMDEMEIHRLFSGELAGTIKQLALYEEVALPRATQAQEEMNLRQRLLAAATARFHEKVHATKQSTAPEVPPVATGDNQSVMPTLERTIEAIPVTSMSPESLKPAPTNEVDPARAELEAFVAANADRRRAEAVVQEEVSRRPGDSSSEKHTGWWDKDFRDAKLSELKPGENSVEAVQASAEADPAARSVASLMAQADRLIAMTKTRREKLDISHKDAKALSDNYAAARSEITKIKNRLKAILDGREVEKKSAEVAELRNSLAKHLWDLRKEFPVSGSTTTESTRSEAESNSAVNGELEELAAKADALLETLTAQVVAEGHYTKLDAVSGESAVHSEQRNRLKGLVARLRALRSLSPNEVRKEELSAVASAIGEIQYALKWAEAVGSPERDSTEVASMPTYTEPDLSVLPGNEWRMAEATPLAAEESVTTPVDPLAEKKAAVVEKLKNTWALRDQESATAPEPPVMPSSSEASLRNTAEDGIVRNFSDNTIDLNNDTLAAADAEFKEAVAAEASTAAQLDSADAIVPLRLLGLQVPTEKDGPFAVRAFREALNIEWQPIKKAAEAGDYDALAKQAKFQEILKVLSYVTEAGLSEVEAKRLRALASEIGSNERVVGELPVNRLVSVEDVAAPVASPPPAGETLSDSIDIPLPIDITQSPEAQPAAESPEKHGIFAAFLSRRENTSHSALSRLPALAALNPLPRRAVSRRWGLIGGALLALLPTMLDNDQAPREVGPMVIATGPVMPNAGDIETTVLPLGEYTVVETDNLWNIAEGDVKGLNQLPALNGVSELDKKIILSDMETALRYNPTLMQSIGLDSTGGTARDPHWIYPGETVDLEAVNDLLVQIKVNRGII